MHGDNADEGNIFREAASRPGVLDDLHRTAVAILGDHGGLELLKLYGLDEEQVQRITPQERDWRIHRFPEDARFYLPSAELQRVWPNAAFYHFGAKSPFGSSRFPDDSFHTLELLYVSTPPYRPPRHCCRRYSSLVSRFCRLLSTAHTS